MSPPERTIGPIGWKGLFGDDQSSDAESSDEGSGADGRPSADAAGPDRSDRRGTDAGRQRTDASPEAAGRSDTDAAIRDERTRSARELSDAEEGSGPDDPDEDPLDDWKTLEEMSGEDRAERDDQRTEPAGEGGTSTAPAGAGVGREGASTPETDTEGVAQERTASSSGGVDDTDDGTGQEDRGIRDRIDDFYARYFLPPSVTDDDFGDEEPAAADTGGGGEGGPGSGTEPSTDTGSTGASAATSSSGSSGGSEPPGETETADEREVETSPESSDESGAVEAAAGASAARSAGRTGEGGAGSTGGTLKHTRDRQPAEEAESPRSDARVRTSESGTVADDEGARERDAASEDSELTLGPIGLKGFGNWTDSTEERATTQKASTARTDRRSAGTAEPARRRTRTDEDPATEEEETLLSRVPWSISLTAIAVGVGLLVFIDIVSMMVPLIAAIGAGIVGGFVAGYISGGTVRGGMHALAVGIIGGVAVGYLTALVGALIGLFLEPATLLGRVVGPITPALGVFGDWGPLLVMVLVTVMVAVDATIAGAVGGTVRSVVDEAR